jgi:molybdenum cofactor cytidylyltransferase
VTRKISVILLAAGESRRMGQPKLLLPWGQTTVLGQVVSMFAAGLSPDSIANKQIDMDDEILVVTGGAREMVEAEVTRLAERYPVRAVYNPEYARHGMLASIQTGLTACRSKMRAALIGLGDQPQVREETVRLICASFVQKESPLVIPSFRGQRGHPWLAASLLWPEILALPPSTTPRQFLNAHARQIEYVATDESILQDLDTLEDYNRQRP